jgi:hypothetical protein
MSHATPLQQFLADHRYLLTRVGRLAGFADPVAIDLDDYAEPLRKAARRGPLLPVDGVLVRDWNPDQARHATGTNLGARLYEIEGVRFAVVNYSHEDRSYWAFDFTAVDRNDYYRLYRIARRCRREAEPPADPPVLLPEQRDALWRNTIGYLDRDKLRRIKEYGGRPKRGVLLTGPPGNGKTSACRWLLDECRRRNWEWHQVTPDAYAEARRACDAEEAVRKLFTVERHGIVFFDDMDLALRDRETVKETDDQAVFLNALDGITVQEGVVFAFTTNCALDLIDRAFKRPGRIDLVLHFGLPDADLRRQLISRWHPDIRAALDVDMAVATTDGFSFAEVEEVKNLLIMHFMDAGHCDWDRALKQLDYNRHELGSQRRRRQVGFGSLETIVRANGCGV